MKDWNRRKFITQSTLGLISAASLPTLSSVFGNAPTERSLRLKISLAQWSLHRTIRKGELNHLDFAKAAIEDFGIDAIEYVNQFFPDKATDASYLKEMNLRAEDHGVKQLLIMIDGEGGLGEPDDAERKQAVENHYKWVDAAKVLGCHSIRVNAYGSSSDRSAIRSAAVDGLGALCVYATSLDINIIVENHGGFSSDGQWLSSVIDEINLPNCGTLPDFGNFCVAYDDNGCTREYDRYKGVEELIPYAKAVSAKSHAFDDHGLETGTDYKRMFDIIRQSDYEGYIGIEYEGGQLSEADGIRKTKALIEQLIF